MNRLGTLLAIVGVVFLIVALAADVIGLGADPQHFGSRQMTGAILGAAVGAIGLVLRRRAARIGD